MATNLIVQLAKAIAKADKAAKHEHAWVPRPEHGQGRYTCSECEVIGKRDLATGKINAGRGKHREKPHQRATGQRHTTQKIAPEMRDNPNWKSE
jgi:hypothetical protein